MTEYRQALLLRPIVDDVREQVRISSFRHRSKKLPGHDRDAISQAARLNQFGGIAHDVWKVVRECPVILDSLSKMAAQRLPVAPPTSTIVFRREKSYAVATAAGSAPWKLTIVSLKSDASSGCLASQSKMGMPSACSNRVFRSGPTQASVPIRS